MKCRVPYLVAPAYPNMTTLHVLRLTPRAPGPEEYPGRNAVLRAKASLVIRRAELPRSDLLSGVRRVRQSARGTRRTNMIIPARHCPTSADEPPRIGGAPLLGCALAYRRDPVGFLKRTRAEVGDIFTLDLAGLEITLVADPHALDTFHDADESVLSARAAQSDIGFGEVLGTLNIHPAADFHRRLLGPDRKLWAGDLRTRIWSETCASLEPLGSASTHPDLLLLVRSMAARVVLGAFVSSDVTRALPDWVDRYARFQDRLEDSIAKSLVLPRWCSDPLLLRPVGRARQQLTRPLAKFLWNCPSPAPYLAALRELLGSDEGAARQAEMCVGFLFAAYKNAGIGAAQTLLMLFEHPSWLPLVRDEIARRSQEVPNLRELPTLECVIRETLRLCALTIGSIRRVAGSPFALGPYRLPVGRFVSASHILMSMRDDAWPDPQRFDPDRFHPDRREYTRVPNAWLPFSAGVHGCPGYRVACDFIACLVVALLERFEELRPAKPPPPLDFQRATLAQRRGPSPVVLHAVATG